MWAHLGGVLVGLAFGWIPALIIRGSATAQRDPYVREQATEALNFQLLWLIINVAVSILGVLTCGIGFFLYIGSLLLPFIFGIMASVATSSGQNYRYPMMMFRLVK
jgi:uncharacterized Tic20 family protein